VLKGDQDGADTESFQRWARRQVHEKLATYFEQLAQDGTRLPDELAQVRSRLRELDPETRAAVARELAARLNVNPSVSPAPPDAPERDGRLLEFRTAVSPRSVRRMLDRQDDADVNPQSFLLTAGALVVAALVLKSATRRHGPASG
jgi:hypothetical protein